MQDQQNLCDFLENEAKIDSAKDREIINTPELKLWIRCGSKLDPVLPIIKGMYVFRGDIPANVFLALLNEERGTWDKSIISQEIVEKLSENIYLLHFAMEPAFQFLPPKDYIEKRIRFNKNNIYYGYCSSIPDKIYPPRENFERGYTLFGGSILKQENGKNIYHTFSQVGLSVFFNEFILQKDK